MHGEIYKSDNYECRKTMSRIYQVNYTHKIMYGMMLNKIASLNFSNTIMFRSKMRKIWQNLM